MRLGSYTGILFVTCLGMAEAAETRFDIDVGYRDDSLRWNIAADIDGATTPNILSELTWNNLRILQLGLGWRATADSGLHMRVGAGYGSIFDGENQDSDYLGNNRTLEFSRSNNDAKGDDVWDLTAALGYRLRVDEYTGYSVTPLLGVSLHAQNLRITNGNQTIPATGSFANLNSTYKAEWTSAWIGIDIEAQGGESGRTFFRMQYHWGDYYGEADWNLRSDFMHPKSFEHEADAKGMAISVGVINPTLFQKGWTGKFSLDYQQWKTDAGIDRTFFSNGTTGTTRLNEVKWRSLVFNVGLQRSF